MPLWKNTQHAFIAGQLDANVMGRQDMDRYFKGATLLKNFLVKRQGCISKRRGTNLVADLHGIFGWTPDGAVKPIGKMRIVPVINGDDGRYLILSGGEAFVADRRGLLTNGNQHAIGIDLSGSSGEEEVEMPRVSGIFAAPYGSGGLDDWAIQTTVSGDDPKKNEKYPFELLHKGEDHMWTSTRYEKLEKALANAADNDIIRLHYDVVFDHRGDWTLENGSSITMSWVGTPGQAGTWHGTYSNWTYAASGNEDDTEVYFSNLGWRAYRTSNVQTVADIESSEWSFDDGGNWTMARFTEGSGGWRVTSGETTYEKTGGSDEDTTVTFDAGTVTATRTSSTSDDWSYSGPAGEWTCAWSYCHFTATSEGWAWMLTDGERTFYNRRSGQNATSVSFATGQLVATRLRKRIRLDLYGYKLTMRSPNTPITVHTRCDVTITSMRPGASVANMGGGNPQIISAKGDSTVTLDGEIEWSVYSLASSPFVSCIDSATLTVKGGLFARKVKGTGTLFSFGSTSARGIFEGGAFESVAKSSEASATRNSIVKSGDLVFNGGDFFMDAPAGENSYIVDNETNSKVTVNGGRFKTSGCAVFAKANATADFSLVRGEFSVREPGESDELTPMGPVVETAVDLSSGNIEDILGDESAIDAAGADEEGFLHVNGPEGGTYGWTGVRYGASLFRLSTPYADEDLADLCIRQSGDTLFIAHRKYNPAKIWFDKTGFAHFEDILFDNTDFFPPSITRCVMVGEDEKETGAWPSEFPRKITSATVGDGIVLSGTELWDSRNCPDWLTGRDVVGDDFANTQLGKLISFVRMCKASGTVTNAGFSGNKADGDDQSCSYACSYTCTSVFKDYVNGKKTTTVYVISFTKTVTKEETIEFCDGQACGSQTKTITTNGSATNSASATSPIVTRSVRYVATYVKDGKESRPCDPIEVSYDMPWSNGAVVQINLARGENRSSPDYYNVYKDNGNGYGLIATFTGRQVISGLTGTVDSTAFLVPTTDPFGFIGAVEFEEKRRWASGSVFRLLVNGSQRTLTEHVSSDVSLIITTSNTSRYGLNLELGSAGTARFDTLTVSLDGRMYDPETDACYVIPSVSVAKCKLVYVDLDGNEQEAVKVARVQRRMSGGGISYVEWPVEWQVLPHTTFDAPNGDKVFALAAGAGDQSELFNDTMRELVFDFSNEFPSMSLAKSFGLTFNEEYYSDFFDVNAFHQAVIRGLEFSCSAKATADVEDDYINPDMTVTPPDNREDPHFSAKDDYPGCVGIYAQRLVFASSSANPSTVWMSRIADLYNFTAHESIREDDAMELTLAATEFPKINHLVMGRDLMLFGDGGEWLISPVSGNTLTYKTASAKLQSMIGSDRRLTPIQVSDEILFGERGGSCLRTINYNYASDSYQSEDLSVIVQSLFRNNPIVSMAYKQHPDSIVECVLKDGRVATLVYMKEQEVAAWSVQELGGGWKAREIVTPKCIVDGTTEMMLLVEKDGRYQLWNVRIDDGSNDAASLATLDAMHMERSADVAFDGETSVYIGNGRYAVGYPIESEFVSVRPEPEKGQTAQMEIKNATEAEVRVTDATTFSVKPYGASSGWREVSLPAVRDGEAVALSSRDCKKLMTGHNNRDGRLHLKHSEPWPITILSVSTSYQIEYENGGNEQ